MPGPGPAPPMLLMLLVVRWLPLGGALSLAQEHLPAVRGPSDAHSGTDAPRSGEFRKLYEHLQARLRLNQSWEHSNPDRVAFEAQIRILTPKLRLGLDGHLHLRISRADLTEGLPASYRLHLALFRLSPTDLSPWDVTRPLQRQLTLRGARARTLHLRLSPQRDLSLAALPPESPQLEVHWRPRAARGRRSGHAHAEDGCPLGAGRCCRLQSLRASLEDLGWASWVVAPRELDVRMCVGACPSQFRSANTHAQMQARLHGLNPDATPPPCCVPASYEPVVLMHQDSDGRVSLTPIDDLVAKDCHCL
ncbi:growth/differentiation factor 15 [Crocuta crocuta]